MVPGRVVPTVKRGGGEPVVRATDRQKRAKDVCRLTICSPCVFVSEHHIPRDSRSYSTATERLAL